MGICGDKNVRGRKWECFEALSVITKNSNTSVARDFSGHNQHLIEGARNYQGAEAEKVTWSPYALINKVKNIWCQWPAFGLADVRCVCKNEDKCNNLENPGKSNRNAGTRTEALLGPLLVLVLASLPLVR